MRFLKKSKLFSQLYSHLATYSTPFNLNYFWSLGAMSGFCLALQIVSGFFCAANYTPSELGAFVSIDHLMQDVMFGYYIRYFHANGASLFFIIVYLHIAKALYYGSYRAPRQYI